MLGSINLQHFPIEGSGSGTFLQNVVLGYKKLGELTIVAFPITDKGKCKGEGFYGYSAEIDLPQFAYHPLFEGRMISSMSKRDIEEYVAHYGNLYDAIMDKYKPKHVNIHHGLFFGGAALQKKDRYFVTLHGTEMIESQTNPYIYDLTMRVLDGAERVIVSNYSQFCLVTSLFSISHSKIKILPLCVEFANFRFSSIKRAALRKKVGLTNRDKVVLFSGRYLERKGLSELVDAEKLYGNSTVEPVTLFVGSDERLSDVGLREVKNSMYLGMVPYTEMPGIYSAADVTVVPSVNEPFGMVVLESLACGTPVVAASSVGALSCELVGQLCESYDGGNTLRFSEKIIDVLERGERLTDGDVDTLINEYDTAAYAEKLNEIYEYPSVDLQAC